MLLLSVPMIVSDNPANCRGNSAAPFTSNPSFRTVAPRVMARIQDKQGRGHSVGFRHQSGHASDSIKLPAAKAAQAAGLFAPALVHTSARICAPPVGEGHRGQSHSRPSRVPLKVNHVPVSWRAETSISRDGSIPAHLRPRLTPLFICDLDSRWWR